MVHSGRGIVYPMFGDSRPSASLFRAALAESRQTEEYWEIVYALHRRGSRDEFELARSLCESPVVRERMLGADVLAQLGTDERPFSTATVAILLKLLDDEDPGVLAATGIALVY